MIHPKHQTLDGFSFIDLFAGMGGFHIALESLGANCVYANEWDKFAQQTYEQNFGFTPDGDITKVDEKKIPDHDILCGGFPCQAFSISGKRRGFEDTRGTLFFDVARIIREKRPRVVFLENVKNFATHDDGNTMAVVRETFSQLGYTLFADVLNPIHYGVPQKRERIYLVAFRDDLGVTDLDFSFPEPFPLKRFVETFLMSPEETEAQRTTRADIVMTKEVPVENVAAALRVGHVGLGRQGERIYSPKGISITFSAYGGGAFSKTGAYLVDGVVRRLHPREAARIMGYPDEYRLHPNTNQAYKQLGNSVIVDVLQLIAQQIGITLANAGQSTISRI